MIRCPGPSHSRYMFSFHLPGKDVGDVFSSGKTRIGANSACRVCSPSTLVTREWKRAIEETDMIRQGMLRCHGNWM